MTPPGDDEAFAEGVLHLLKEPELARSMGRDARRYAERTFDIKTIAERFESLLSA